ncbi:transcription factor TFIIH complex subunit Tfb2 [Gonapodya prolifera JEL478]|uniref:RNA polymerase II transcription factor B subunit 2 n=1 Tax=Gonapodya prolifera (strain JEL478) TaxID=1344416 RepID=A0A139A6M0_GONPJ|nr:transcription factor TFIIH complex subunit Tfb2 [Gonapodya prolifera JEL478]|eukprot:KXS12462.1 transcription factor TFIIH complex subunit Tfb2 [Gonapodya prolifera JEL478]
MVFPLFGESGLIKAHVTDILETFSKAHFAALYAHPASCLAVFRLLPELGRVIVMRLLYLPAGFPAAGVRMWVGEAVKSELEDTLERLRTLQVTRTDDSDRLSLNKIFQTYLLKALTMGTVPSTDKNATMINSSFGQIADRNEEHRSIDVTTLDAYAKEQWESVLFFLVNPVTTKPPSRSVQELLQKSGLMGKDDAGELKITSKGFQFLLQDVNTQVWSFLLVYLDMTPRLQIDTVEALQLLFTLGFLELGQDYAIEPLTPSQRAVLSDLKHLGIVYHKKNSARFFPTKIAVSLTTDTSVATTDENRGYIVLETNYKMYAFTESPLHLSVLAVFAELKSRFRGLTTAAITRDSVRSALECGITASQIIAYLQAHAHPMMKKNNPVMPPVIADQLRIWENERNRLSFENGYLYSGFGNADDYAACVQYARDINALLLEVAEMKKFIVAEGANGQVAAFVKRRLQSGSSA